MKTNKFFTIAMLFAASCAATSCSVSDDEKAPEQVEDPIKNVVEYYITGKVTEGSSTLSGVSISIDGTTVTTDANGEYKATVTEKGSFTVSASKDGYLNVNNLTVIVPNNAQNRSAYTLNFGMTQKADAAELPAVQNKTILVTQGKAEADKNMSNVSKGTGVIIPADKSGDIETNTTVTMTEYVPEQQTASIGQGTEAVDAAVMNVYVETSKDVTAEGVILAIKNPVAEGKTTFKTLDVFASNKTRAGENYVKVGTAVFNGATNSFQIELTNGKLAGDYSFRINAQRTVGAVQEVSIKSDKVDNSGNFEAKKDVKISYEAPMGWVYTKGFESSMDVNLTALLKNAINAQEGAEGTFNTKFEHTTNVSGNSIMYYEAKSCFTTNQYTFELSDKSVTVELKKYTGANLYYRNESADQHSGGTNH